MNLYENLVRKADETIGLFHKELIALNDDIAEHPEIGGSEFRTVGADTVSADRSAFWRDWRLKICRMIWMRIFILSELLMRKLTAESRR